MLTFRHRTNRTDEGQRLDNVLNRWLPEAIGRPVSRSAVRRLVLAGEVVVGDRPVRRPGFLLAAGVRITAYVDPARITAAPDAEPAPEGLLDVLWEDEALIAVSKPAGLMVHRAADATRGDLFSLVQRLLGNRAGSTRPGGEPPYLALHHRLDRDTSGIVLFAKAREANGGLARQFGARTVRKTYLALAAAARRPPGPEEWVVRNRLASIGTGRSSRMAAVPEGGEEAVTAFRILSWRGSAGLVAAHPVTGRKHQIRAHLAGCGLPIAGDGRYGGPTEIDRVPVGRTMLHAGRLELDHPVTGVPLAITCELPEDFGGLLRALGLDAGLDAGLTAARHPR